MNSNTLLDTCRSALPRWLELLERLVNTDSGSKDLDGLARMADLLSERWEALGFAIERVETDTGPQLIASRRSPRPGAPKLLLIGHTDTVFTRGTVQQRPFEIRDERAYGPGVADMKGGLVGMLGVVEALRAHDLLDSVSLIAVNNCDEEISSVHSRELIESHCDGCRAAFVFEPGRADGSIVTARKGGIGYALAVAGKAAHAGVNPQDGASAILALGRKVVALHALNEPQSGLSVNVGVLQGGTRANVVAERARAEIDVRTTTPEMAERVKADIARIAARSDVPGTQSALTLRSERPPMNPSDETNRLIELFQRSASDLGFELNVAATGGGSDGNFTAARGVPTVDALGPVGGGYHSDREYLEVDSIPQRAALAACVIARLGANTEGAA